MTEEPNHKVIMILNMQNDAILPRHFRTSKDEFKTNENYLPSRKGLNELNVSGSAQFSEESLKVLLKHLGNPQKLSILDLRQESHGFLNGTAVSWFALNNWANLGKTLEEVEKNEQELLAYALQQQKVTLYRIVKKSSEGDTFPETTPFSFHVKTSQTEKMLAAQLSIGYVRIPVTDHLRPTDENVDQFVYFVQSLPKDQWLHIHCAAGVGRTTTFMVMYDILKNARHVSFDDIMKRQWFLGGMDLKKIPEKYPWKAPHSIKRFQFVKEFYQYCMEHGDDFKVSWTEYTQKAN
jgi:hypothetical protein